MKEIPSICIVDLGPELGGLVLLTTFDGSDIGPVDADDAVFELFAVEVVGLLT